MAIRAPTQDDVPQMAELMHYVWHKHYSSYVPELYAQTEKSPERCHASMSEALAKSLIQPTAHMLSCVADTNGEMAGYIYMSSEDAETTDSFFHIHGFDAELERFYISPHYQRQGLGKQLLFSAAQWCQENNKKSICLWTFADNQTAFDFYAKHGAKVFKKTSYNYIEKDVDLLILAWDDFPKAILQNA